MTMHLAQGLTTTRSCKPVSKCSATEEQLRKDHKAYNLNLRKQYLHNSQVTFDEYCKLRKNELSRQSASTGTFKFEPTSYRRTTPHIPSRSDGIGNGSAQEPKRYTGNLVRGISTMHKSNAVPVINEQHMKDIASMRR